MKTSLHLIGYAYGEAAGDHGCKDGPDVFKQSAWYKKLLEQQPEIIWDTTFYPDPFSDKHDKYNETNAICQCLARETQTLTQNGDKFIIIGGDHSSAMGTWSGVAQALSSQGKLGLIWIDAHMDSHTPETSLSGNIHGMPLAVLLGYGHPQLTQLLKSTEQLLPEHVCLIGVRSFESGEADLLKQLGVRIFFMEEIKERGLPAVFAEALHIVEKNTIGFGISIDLDALDPNEAPGVGTPAADGLSLSDLCESLANMKDKQNFLGAEITEFNPHHDQNHKTEEAIYELICTMRSSNESINRT